MEGEIEPLKRRLEVEILEVIQSTYNDSKLFNSQFSNKPTHTHTHRVVSLLSRSWSKSGEWSAIDAQNCEILKSHLEDTCCVSRKEILTKEKDFTDKTEKGYLGSKDPHRVALPNTQKLFTLLRSYRGATNFRGRLIYVRFGFHFKT